MDVNQFPAKRFLRLVGEMQNSKFWLVLIIKPAIYENIILHFFDFHYAAIYNNNSYVNSRRHNSNPTIYKSIPIILKKISFTVR